VLAALVLAGCGAGSAPPATHRLASATPTIGKPPPPPPKPRPPTVSPAERALRAALAGELRRGGAQSGAIVYDLTAHRVLFAVRATVRRPPASVEKLYTSVAVLKRLGAAARLTTEVLGTGQEGRHGTWHGNLYLRGGGDPTFGDETFDRDWEGGYGPTPNELVDQLKDRGIARLRGSVIGDPTLFNDRPGGPNTHYAPDIPDIGGELAGLTYDHGATATGLSPGAFAAREFASTMKAMGIPATARTSTADAPPDAQRLAAVSSPSMAILLRLMNVPSDDFFAEMLDKQLGVRFGRGGSTTAGARVISSVIASYGLHPTIVDGSGLSRVDDTSPAQVVDLLRDLWGTPVGRVLEASLPTVGVSGTVARIADRTAAQGHCLAKTGTLDNVTNLAGYCHSRDRHTLAFAAFVDGPTNEQGVLLLGRMVATIAKY
jgi:D-alanyl-D-alanine carboxypeptidase/D-alanyl-D-alanine-endopeptidase (penicillin-binding protein 4)